MKRIIYFAIFVLIFLFYWNTDINNHTEADDAFEYAHMVEVDNHEWLYHPHHLIYGPASKTVYKGMQAMGYAGRAYPLLVFISSLSAAGAVFLFYRFCRRCYGMRPVSSLFATGFLALSYGFWRYACEAEVVLPAGFLVLLSVYLALAPKARTESVVMAAIVSGVSVLFHVMNGVPAFIAIPLFYILHRKFRFAVIHSAIAGGMVLLVYLIVFAIGSHPISTQALPPLSDRLSLVLLPKAMVGFGQCLVSGNFMFSYQAFSERMVQLFPARMLMEEVYTGNHNSGFYPIVPLLSLIVLSASVFLGLIRASLSWKRGLSENQSDMRRPLGGWQIPVVVGLWFFIYAAALLLMEPGNPEVWVLGLLPFWLLACRFFIVPIARANELWVVLLVLVLLGLHNYVGGIRMLKDSDADYNQQKAAWVLEHAGQDDLIITAGNPVFLRYLRYYSESEVADLNYVGEEDLEFLFDDGQRVYILNDVFDYPPSMRIRFPEAANRVDAYAAELKPYADKIVDNEFGGVWELHRDTEVEGRRSEVGGQKTDERGLLLIFQQLQRL